MSLYSTGCPGTWIHTLHPERNETKERRKGYDFPRLLFRTLFSHPFPLLTSSSLPAVIISATQMSFNLLPTKRESNPILSPRVAPISWEMNLLSHQGSLVHYGYWFLRLGLRIGLWSGWWSHWLLPVLPFNFAREKLECELGPACLHSSCFPKIPLIEWLEIYDGGKQ